MKRWMTLLTAGMLGACSVGSAANEELRAPKDKPNILFICTDDQAPWALGASGNKQAITPHMDKLVSEGAYLVNAFVSTPVCSPSRAATLTGLYGHEAGVRNWVQFGKKAAGQGLDPASVTSAELLKKAGYSTALIGKWHLGEEPHHHPNKHGFDYFMGHIQGGFAVNNPRFQRNGAPVRFQGLTADVLADDVISRLESHAAEEQKKPFFIAWHTRAPHTRWLPVAPEDMAPYNEPGFRADVPDYPNLDRAKVDRWMKEYLASTRSVDRNLGRVMETLEKMGLSENTIVIYTSDHGYNMGHHGIWHKGNGHWILKNKVPRNGNIGADQRPNMWENSIRVPSFVRWPGKIEAGIRIEADTTNLDWFPTILAMAGVEQPADLGVRGENLLPLLTGKSDDTKRDGVFSFLSFYEDYARVFIGELRMWRTDEWKLVRDFRNPHLDELYDLKNDPGETTNQIDNPEHKAVIQQLHERIVAEMRDSNDPALRYLPAADRPNFVIIMADDFGYAGPSCFGNPHFKTPEMDRLAADGMKFTDFHSSGAVCSPTRAGLLTGRYQQRTGVETIIFPWGHHPEFVNGLQPSEITFAEAMKGAGYATGMVGKWHLGYAGQFPGRQYHPMDHGFDFFRGYLSGNIDFVSHVGDHMKHDWWHGRKETREEGYTTHLINKHALEFIQQNKDRPFCLYVAHEAIHSPIQVPGDPVRRTEEKWTRWNWKEKSVAQRVEKYKGMTLPMDEGIGQIRRKLEELGIADNTFILFFSDNGDTPEAPDGSPTLRGQKGLLYEGGHRVPAIAVWPGKIKPGSHSDQTAISIDVMPTVLSLAGVKLPKRHQLDGMDLSPTLLDQKPLPDRSFFWTRHRGGRARAIRKGPWKLVVSFGRRGPTTRANARVELFNLDDDLGETRELAKQHPDRAAAMYEELTAWYADTQRTATLQPSQQRKQPRKGASAAAKPSPQWAARIAAADPGSQADAWAKPGFDDSAWKTMKLPGHFDKAALPGFDGVVWFRKTIELSAEQVKTAKPVLGLGQIDDMDVTWVNGKRVGGYEVPGHYYTVRNYPIPAGTLRAGKNTIAVRVMDRGRTGGIAGKPEELVLRLGGQKISLANAWRYAPGANLAKLKAETIPSPAKRHGGR